MTNILVTGGAGYIGSHCCKALAAASFVPVTLDDLRRGHRDSPDGTCIRDYIHVNDLAEAQVLTLRRLLGGADSMTLNIGTGQGLSVRQVIAGVEKACERKVPLREGPRRAGDPAALLADPSRARTVSGFVPSHSTIDTIVQTAWRWHNRA